MQNTCSTGQVWNYGASVNNPPAVANPVPALQDYMPIVGQSYVQLPSTGPGAVVLANEGTTTRPDGLVTGNVFLYNLQITQNGLLSLSYSINGGAYTNVISAQSISASNGALPPTLRFGFAGSTGGDTNVHEILCFKAAPSAVPMMTAGRAPRACQRQKHCAPTHARSILQSAIRSESSRRSCRRRSGSKP